MRKRIASPPFRLLLVLFYSHWCKQVLCMFLLEALEVLCMVDTGRCMEDHLGDGEYLSIAVGAISAAWKRNEAATCLMCWVRVASCCMVGHLLEP